MTCAWERNTDRKLVKWFRQAKKEDYDEVPIWAFQGDESSDNPGSAEADFVDKIKSVKQESYATYHRIFLLNALKEDEGFYYCTVDVPPDKKFEHTQLLLVNG